MNTGPKRGPVPIERAPRALTPRLQHIAAHAVGTSVTGTGPAAYDEILVFGQEIDALRHILGKTDWVYAAVSHGQPFTDALNGSRNPS